MAARGPGLGLDQLYRALDVLALEGEAIEQEVFWHAVDLFKLEVDLVFYDATTAWFAIEDEDIAEQAWRGLAFPPLRKRGHSKEGRDNDPQVIVGLPSPAPPRSADRVRFANRIDRLLTSMACRSAPGSFPATRPTSAPSSGSRTTCAP